MPLFVRTGTVITAMWQQACSYGTVDGAILCFSPKLISEHVYSEHWSRFTPKWSTSQHFWCFNCVLVPKFSIRESKILMVHAEQGMR